MANLCKLVLAAVSSYAVMPLSPGTRLATYEILSPIGAGGMGEVYRASDTKLNRDVAIKVLPEAFAHDPQRLARFEREAQLLASLNHPNIAAIHELGQSGDLRFLVLEFVPGENLAGPLPVDDALRICRQIADALEAAHAKGIIHRDLKPANVKITPDGKVKVLDFGLAKALAEEAPAGDPSQSPTVSMSAAMSRAGVILGTAAYMSPAQARGQPLDKRTDIWSFGCVLYEALAGRRAFGGESIPDTLSAVLRGEPDWTALPARTPENIRRLLRRCLEKDPERRLHDIADARIEMDDAGATVSPAIPPPRTRLSWWPLAVAAIAIIVAVWGWLRPASRAPAGAAPVRRLVVPLPEGQRLAQARSMPLGVEQPLLALSPDGSRLVYVVERKDTTELYQRLMDQFESMPIPGTQGAYGPFFSPDGRWIGFFAENKLKKVAASGGEPVTLCEARLPRGASWGADGTILFTQGEGNEVSRVPETGGDVSRVVPKSEQNHWWPEILPGGKAALFSSGLGVGVLSLESGEDRPLVEGGVGARYLPTGPDSTKGHLVFARAGSLMAAPFDLARLAVTGAEAPVLQGVRADALGLPQCALSRNGTLVYVPGAASGATSTPVWVDRQGRAMPLGMPHRAYGAVRLSPDGNRLAITVTDPKNEIWIQDLARGTFTRLTPEGNSLLPAWTPDGKRVAFVSSRGGPPNLFWIAADGSAEAELLIKSDRPHRHSSFSPDGQVLVFTEIHPNNGGDIWVLSLKGERTARPFLRTRFSETFPAFSPDGRWIAYSSDESGQYEVYVRPYPGPGGRLQVSQGGEEPIWSRDGRELFYRNGQKWMVAAATLKPEFKAETPRPLFEGPYLNVPGMSYDVHPDGKRFLLLLPAGTETPVTQLHVVLNWFEELKQKAAAGR